MKSSLVLMHVINAFVLLNASKINTSDCSGTNGQTHFSQHSDMNILLTSCDTLLKQSANYMWKLKMWKCEQCLQIYNNVVNASSVQISNNESISLENEIVRVLQSNFVTNQKQSKNSLYKKILSMNKLLSISSISPTTYKWTFKEATLRYITVIERLNGKKNDYGFDLKRAFFEKTKITACWQIAKWV
ncbi:hypothetical protein RFI_16405 [Reticulomyxa filosa]|uniref:Uncharacterized protein n=1 Tax=Reticulomyxa filosa TaxID=46433 RepID=X6N682_RETFI|nr:hypothetical protein RFI_16405 [Reticulomyxa filosa]|eukprot:ETO20812.1 hypothetical protein RFI_16405 [Reticulomyxa filosa]